MMAAVSDKQIRGLRREALSAGDYVTAVACDVALDEVEVTPENDDGEGYPDYSGGGHSARELDRIRAILRGGRDAAREICADAIASARAMAEEV